MSGIEVAGIVLAVLPIAVKSAKACSEGFEASKMLFKHKPHNELKRDLFDDVYRELVLFNRHMRKVLEALPNISEQSCVQILNSLDPSDWSPQSEITVALKTQLGDDFDHYEHALKQVFNWLNGVLTDQRLQSQATRKDPAAILKDLKVFAEPSHVDSTKSKFSDRLYLWRSEGKLKKEVKNLKKWRVFLERLTEKFQYQQIQSDVKEESKAVSRPSCIVPQLSREVYQVLSSSWKCKPECIGTHHVKLCLQNDAQLHRQADWENVKFKLLISTPANHATLASERWLETAVTAKIWPRKTMVHFDRTAMCTQVQSICSTISKHPLRQGAKLCFTIDHFEQDLRSEIYQARNYHKSHFDFHPSAKEVKLNDILANIGKVLDLTQRRKLALDLSYGMMTLSGSPWLQDRWSKEHISFFHKDANSICHAQPLVSSDMKHCAYSQPHLPVEVMHPLPPILSLGILLLELETGKTIESMRTEDDYIDPINLVADENTDFTAAIREAEARQMLSPLYKEAVLACLNEQEWDDGQDTGPSVLQERIRKKIYTQIIHKLESDLEALMA